MRDPVRRSNHVVADDVSGHNLTYDPRAVGGVRRYHTWSVLSAQSVGEHTWQIMRILLTVWPRVPRRVLVYCVRHDMGEMAGDIPYPFKLLFPGLKHEMNKAENEVLDKMGKQIGVPEAANISAFERDVFKLCENIEMWEYALHEMNLGNKYANIIRHRMMDQVAKGLEWTANTIQLPENKEHDQNLPVSIHKYILQRMKMEGMEENV
jgi:hypothetical protein